MLQSNSQHESPPNTITGSEAVLVYDVGGSHVSAAVCIAPACILRGISRAPLTDAVNHHHSNPAFGFVRLLHALGHRAADNAGIPLSAIAGAGIAMPGPFDYEHGISQMQHKLLGLFGVDLKSAIATRFSWQPSQVRFVNDAAAYLLGEMSTGAARGSSRAIGITLGTGIGCAFGINDGSAPHVVTSGPGVPSGGEIWNLPYNGATVEDFVSTRFLRQQFQSVTGNAAEVSEIATIAASSSQNCPGLDDMLAVRPSVSNPADPDSPYCRARQAFNAFGRHLGQALILYAAPFAPDIIVLGGGISRAAPLFLPATRHSLDSFAPKIAISALMDDAPLAGAGVNWFTGQ